jgi:Holliday junction DNA helicase RuvA
MIGRLTGKILACTPARVLLDVSGVGYDVHIPLSTFYALSASRESTVSLHVHTHVREEALQLYGFASGEERAAFERLIGIAGVGPRLGLAILSGIGVAELREAVAGQDRDRLQKIPGVGKKTAERLLLELRDKPLAGDDGGAVAAAAHGALAHHGDGGTRSDAVSALINLGYARNVAAGAVDAALESADAGATLETVLRGALGHLVR